MNHLAQYIQQHWAWLIAVVSIIAAGVYQAINLYVTKRRSLKAFSYSIILDSPFLSKKYEAIERVQMLLDGNPVPNVRVIIIELRNTGAKELTPGDFHTPVNIALGRDCTVLQADVVDTHPDQFKPSVEVKDFTVSLIPILMNPGDRVKIMVLAGIPTSHKLVIGGRIAGVASLQTDERRTTMRKERLRRLLLLFVSTLIVSMFVHHGQLVFGVSMIWFVMLIAVTSDYDQPVKAKTKVGNPNQ